MTSLVETSEGHLAMIINDQVFKCLQQPSIVNSFRWKSWDAGTNNYSKINICHMSCHVNFKMQVEHVQKIQCIFETTPEHKQKSMPKNIAVWWIWGWRLFRTQIFQQVMPPSFCCLSFFFVLHRRLGSWNCNWRSPTNNGQLIWSKIWNPLTNHMIKIQRRHQSPLQGSDDNFHIVCTPAVPAHQWSYLAFAQNAQLPASSLSNGWFLFGQALHIVQSLVSQCEGKLQTQWYTGLSSKSK